MMPGASASFGSEKSFRSTRLYPVDTAEKSEDADCSIVSSDFALASSAPPLASTDSSRKLASNRAMKSW